MRPTCASLLWLLLLAHAAAAQSQSQIEELRRISIEELAETDITGSGRRAEQLDHVARAVSVITSDDLRRYDVMNLPQALRLADTMHVAQVAEPGYAISLGGFNITTANKMLVMIDGRTVYSPVFAGVFWEAQDLLIADIDRIEVEANNHDVEGLPARLMALRMGVTPSSGRVITCMGRQAASSVPSQP